MTPRNLARFLGLWAVIAGVELLERAAYRAGAWDTARAIADDELEAVDLSDVLAAHGIDVDDLADDAEWARGHEQ